MSAAPETAVPPPLRWWGWGNREVRPSEAFRTLLHDEIGLRDRPPAAHPSLREVTLPPSRLAPALRARLAAIAGEDHLATDPEQRVRHAAGRSYLDLLALRGGRLDAAPDAVVSPGSEAELDALLQLCSESGCAVVPFGGGTSVVGGVAPRAGAHGAVVSLDLHRLDVVSDVDQLSLTARLGAGLRGPRVEQTLRRRGLTLGHYPQSFEYATIGGYAATRSAGQASTGVGRFDELVRGVRCVTPAGVLALPAQPASAAGPSLLQLVLGSEGTLGVITEVTAQLHRLPARRRYEGWALPSFSAGVEALRELAQEDLAPDVARLSDDEETRVGLAVSDHGSALDRLARGYLRLRGRPCLLITGWEGDGAAVGSRARLAAAVLRGHGAIPLGAAAGASWRKGRFEAPYLRDTLMDSGVMVETLETATTWSRLEALREGVANALRAALRDRGTPALVGCHISHVYRSGASLYFTVLARQAEDDLPGQWRAAKAAASGVIVRRGATITHHHGVGEDHAPYLEAERGALGIALLQSLRERLDPAGIMNPGKLVPAPRATAPAG